MTHFYLYTRVTMARTHLFLAVILAAVCTASAVRVPYHSKVVNPVVQPVAPAGDDMLCELCDFAANYAENWLEQNGTEAEVVRKHTRKTPATATP